MFAGNTLAFLNLFSDTAKQIDYAVHHGLVLVMFIPACKSLSLVWPPLLNLFRDKENKNFMPSSTSYFTSSVPSDRTFSTHW